MTARSPGDRAVVFGAAHFASGSARPAARARPSPARPATSGAVGAGMCYAGSLVHSPLAPDPARRELLHNGCHEAARSAEAERHAPGSRLREPMMNATPTRQKPRTPAQLLATAGHLTFRAT